jgi:hypothetical protein
MPSLEPIKGKISVLGFRLPHNYSNKISHTFSQFWQSLITLVMCIFIFNASFTASITVVMAASLGFQFPY